jgi:hypothetical protein
MPSAALDRLNNRTSTKLSTYQFPDDLGSDKSKYYVQFSIYQTQPHQFPKLDFLVGGGGEYTLGLKRPASNNPDVVISLYMPATITNVQTASYQSVDVGMVAAAIKAVGGEQDIQNMDFAKTLTLLGSEVASQYLKSAGGDTRRNLAALAELSTGKVVNNRSELSFDGIDRRAFTFDFKMYPRNTKEAESIKQIVKAFRTHMAPGIGDSLTGKTLVVPSLFSIEFKPNGSSKNKKDDYLPRIGRSVCTSCSVNYGGARPQFLTDGSPVETSITLSFQELEIITKERISVGY